jgi:uncharacterized membrane protein
LTHTTRRETIPAVQTGAEQLRAWIERRFSGSQRDAVEYLAIPGIDEVVLSKILNAGRRPELEKLVTIEEKTGVPVRAWVSGSIDESESVELARGRKSR